MPKYLDTRGTGVLSVAICDRCRFKFPLSKLSPDMDKPSLRVCRDCNDLRDPWRLPAAKSESVSIPNPRPDEPLK